jgi:undecaprenyl-diphosphatase
MHALLSYAILGLVEGLTEFIPVSSTGHLIIAHDLLGITDNGLAVDAVLQLATGLAVVIYFWKDLLSLLYATLYKLTGRPYKEEDWKLVLAVIVGTIPAIILGLLLEKAMETVFRDPHIVAYTAIAGGVVMLVAEYARRAHGAGEHTVNIRKGFVIGLFQCLALVPGMSRSGMTIAGGLFSGLSREGAARFGFLLAVPLILGSGLKKLLDLYLGGELTSLGTPLLVGSAVAFISGLAAIHLLLLFLRKQPLYVFVAYRFALAALILAYF